MATFYRGRLTFYDLYNMPAGMFLFLWNNAINKSQTEEGKQEAQGVALEEEMAAMMGGS